MKTKQKNRLHLDKQTLQNLVQVLDDRAQQELHGGSVQPKPNTEIPYYC